MARMIKSRHVHPNPFVDRLIQYGALALSALMLLSVPLQILLTLLGAPGGLFVVTGIVVLLLVPPVLMLTANTPAVTLQEDGLWLEPRIWRRTFVPWEQIEAFKDYPLIPKRDEEVQRRTFVGRKNYAPAAGVMLVIPALPPQYRIAAFFAGEPGHGVVALTNRTHTEYPKLLKKLKYRLGEVQPHA